MIIIVLLAMPDFEYPGHSEKLDDIWEIVCLFISFLGLGIRVFTIGFTPPGTSGTNTRRQIAKELNTTGMYSLTRHPLYLGNFIIWFGISLFFHLWWVILLVILIFWLYYERIMFAEKEFLRENFGTTYLMWAEKAPAFIPNFNNWRRPKLKFSIKQALKNEYKSFFAIIVSYVVIEILGDIFIENRFELDRMWLAMFCPGLTFYLVIRILKKKTRILHETRR